MVVDAKICGVVRPGDAAFAVSQGAHRIGVIFAGGPRLVTVEQARAVADAAGSVPVIGVFGPRPLVTMLKEIRESGLRGAQLYGVHQPATARALRDEGIEVWNVVPIDEQLDLDATLAAAGRDSDVTLIEASIPGGSGGKGVVLSLALARRAREHAAAARFALAGGLSDVNVGEAIRVVGPDIVDVSSGIESSPGVKDHKRLASFLENVRGARSTA